LFAFIIRHDTMRTYPVVRFEVVHLFLEHDDPQIFANKFHHIQGISEPWSINSKSVTSQKGKSKSVSILTLYRLISKNRPAQFTSLPDSVQHDNRAFQACKR
jgi:hypothetical protein